MTDRRTLIDGLKSTPLPIDDGKEKEFVYGEKAKPPQMMTPTTPTVNRVPISTRMREDFAKALKRASLERQLKGLGAQYTARHPGRSHRAVAEKQRIYFLTHSVGAGRDGTSASGNSCCRLAPFK